MRSLQNLRLVIRLRQDGTQDLTLYHILQILVWHLQGLLVLLYQWFRQAPMVALLRTFWPYGLPVWLAIGACAIKDNIDWWEARWHDRDYLALAAEPETVLDDAGLATARQYSVADVSRIYGVPMSYLSENAGPSYGTLEWLTRMYVDACLTQGIS